MNKMLEYLGFRITQHVENVRGYAVLKIKCKDDWYFGVVFSEDWKEFFVGYYKRG